MPELLNENIKKQIQELFANLQNPVALLFFETSKPEDCQYCADTRQMLEEVSALSETIHLHIYDVDDDAETARQYHVDGAPGIVIAGQDATGAFIDYGIRFKGIPAGHEFTSLVNDIVLVSGRDANLNADTRAFLRDLKKPVHLQVFVTPT